MRRVALVAVVSGLSLLSGAGFAQEAAPTMPPAPEPGRYAFERVPDGIMRLDRQTGHVTLCGHGGSGWTCKAVADERAALENEIGRLQSEIGRLQIEIATLRKDLLARSQPPAEPKQEAKPDSKTADPVPPTANAPETPRMPTDADLERVRTFVEGIWRRLVEMMANVQREMQRKS